jgi:nitrite transporter NirC
MPIPVAEAVLEAGDVAAMKAKQVKSLPRCLINSVVAGAYVGVAVALLVSITGPLVAAGSPMAGLVPGAVSGVALTDGEER